MENKVSLRPVIENLIIGENISEEEKFQNQVLRPILKMQHDLLIAFFNNYLERKKMEFYELKPSKKKAVLANIFSNDLSFKLELRGLIIGNFTEEEYATYNAMNSDLSKRIYSMAMERILSVA